MAEFVGNTQELGRSLLSLQSEFQQTKDVRLSFVINDVKSRLMQLGDASLRLKNITEEQARVQSSLANREGFLANFFGSDREGRRQLEQERLAGIRAFQAGSFEGLSIKDQQNAVRFFQSAQGIENFQGSGQNTSEIFSRLLRNSDPAFFAGDLERNRQLQAERERRMADSLQAKEVLAGFERLQLGDFANRLDSTSAKFFEVAQQLKEINIPETITFQGSLQPLEVYINGADFFRTDEFSALLTKTIRREISRVIPVDGPSAKPNGVAPLK